MPPASTRLQKTAPCAGTIASAGLEAVGEMSEWGRIWGRTGGRGLAFTLALRARGRLVEVTNTPTAIRIDKVFVGPRVGAVLVTVNLRRSCKAA